MTFDHVREIVTVELGSGDVEVDSTPLEEDSPAIVLADLGQRFEVGQPLDESHPSRADSRFIKIGGTYEGLRAFAYGLLLVLKHRNGAEVELTDHLRWCTICGARDKQLVDTGQFMICFDCIDSMHDLPR